MLKSVEIGADYLTYWQSSVPHVDTKRMCVSEMFGTKFGSQKSALQIPRRPWTHVLVFYTVCKQQKLVSGFQYLNFSRRFFVLRLCVLRLNYYDVLQSCRTRPAQRRFWKILVFPHFHVCATSAPRVRQDCNVSLRTPS